MRLLIIGPCVCDYRTNVILCIITNSMLYLFCIYVFCCTYIVKGFNQCKVNKISRMPLNKHDNVALFVYFQATEDPVAGMVLQ